MATRQNWMNQAARFAPYNPFVASPWGRRVGEEAVDRTRRGAEMVGAARDAVGGYEYPGLPETFRRGAMPVERGLAYLWGGREAYDEAYDRHYADVHGLPRTSPEEEAGIRAGLSPHGPGAPTPEAAVVPPDYPPDPPQGGLDFYDPGPRPDDMARGIFFEGQQLQPGQPLPMEFQDQARAAYREAPPMQRDPSREAFIHPGVARAIQDRDAQRLHGQNIAEMQRMGDERAARGRTMESRARFRQAGEQREEREREFERAMEFQRAPLETTERIEGRKAETAVTLAEINRDIAQATTEGQRRAAQDKFRAKLVDAGFQADRAERLAVLRMQLEMVKGQQDVVNKLVGEYASELLHDMKSARTRGGARKHLTRLREIAPKMAAQIEDILRGEDAEGV